MTTSDPTPARSREAGRAEYWILLATALVLGYAFLWGLVLHDPPPRLRGHVRNTAAVSTDTTLPAVAPTLPPPRKYQTTGAVNIRQGPATNTTVVGRIAGVQTITVECRTTGESVTATVGSSDQWLRITTPAGPGFVSAVYVDVGNDLENARRLGTCPKT